MSFEALVRSGDNPLFEDSNRLHQLSVEHTQGRDESRTLEPGEPDSKSEKDEEALSEALNTIIHKNSITPEPRSHVQVNDQDNKAKNVHSSIKITMQSLFDKTQSSDESDEEEDAKLEESLKKSIYASENVLCTEEREELKKYEEKERQS